jgi:hypothetical protein
MASSRQPRPPGFGRALSSMSTAAEPRYYETRNLPESSKLVALISLLATIPPGGGRNWVRTAIPI